MKKLRKFMVYLDDGMGCYKVAIPEENIRMAKTFVQGNGDIISIKDITNDYPISLDKVINALKQADFGDVEIQLITRTLQNTDIAE